MMSSLQYCRCCLATDSQFCKLSDKTAEVYKVLTGLPLKLEPKSEAFCYTCENFMTRVHHFQEQCLYVNNIINDSILSDDGIDYNKIRAAKRNVDKTLNFCETNKIDREKPDDTDYHSNHNEVELTCNGSEPCFVNIYDDIIDKVETKSNFSDNDYEKEDDIPLIRIKTEEDNYELSIDVGDGDQWEARNENVTSTKSESFENSEISDKSACKQYNVSSTTEHLSIEIEETKSEHKGCDYVCDYCKKSFVSRHSLMKHIASHTSNDFVCNICNQRFIKPKSFINHMKTHSVDKPFSCHVCNQNFNRFDIFKMHLGSHDGKKPFTCDVCNQAFRLKSMLKIHLRTHTGEKKYQCSHCDKRYKSSESLNIHLRTHTGETPYKCTICPKQFRALDSLKLHINKHFGLKPFACKLCDKKYTRTNALAYHMRSHSDVKPFKCNICDERFLYKRKWQCHVRSHEKFREHSFKSTSKCG